MKYVWVFILLASQCGAALIELPAISDFQVFQRDYWGHSKLIRFTGATNPAVKTLQLRMVQDSNGAEIIGWRTARIDSTGYLDSLRVQEGGWYRVEFMTMSACGDTLESFRTPRFGVGAIFLAIGQSNISGRGKSRPYREASSLASMVHPDSGWIHLRDPYDAGGKPGQVDYDDRHPGYSMMPALVNTVIAKAKIPIAIIPASKGSTFMTDWSLSWSIRNPYNHQDPATLYGNALAKARAAGGAEAILMIQGEKDVALGVYETYKYDFGRMLSNFREDLWRSIPIFYAEIGNNTLAPDTALENIQRAQRDMQSYRMNILAASGKTLNAEIDSAHYTAESLDTLGNRFGRAILQYLRLE